MPLCHEEAVLQRVAAALTTTLPRLDSRWQEHVSAGWRSAIAYLTSAIGLQSYSADQITQADQFATWHEDLAYVFAMLRGVGLAEYNLDAVKAFDPRKMLEKPVVLLFGGKPMPPDGTSDVGGISTGTLTYRETVRCETEKYFR